MSAVLGILGWAALVVGIEVIRVRIRRPILRKWVQRQGLTLKSARYSFRMIRPAAYFRSIVPFTIEVEDATGHVTPGLVWVSGFLRRQCWVEWGYTGWSRSRL
jgi:hypothetical protein